MPKFLYQRYQQDYKVQKKLKEVFDRFYELSVDGSHYINKFLEVYEKDSMCGYHMFSLKQVASYYNNYYYKLVRVSITPV